MDPLGNQPAQPNPQPAATPVPVMPAAPVAEIPRSPQATPPATPLPERPVEAWPPAGTPAAEEAANIASAPAPSPMMHTPNEAQTVGTEVAEAAGAIPVVSPAPSPASTIVPPSSPQDMNGFITPAAQELKNAVNSAPTPPETLMSDTQADQLFQEEPATKARNKKHKVKKVLIGLIALVITLAIAAGAYIFIFGNKAAQNYVDTSSITVYKESFSKIQTSLGKQPIDSAELEAGFSKLKIASQNSKSLAPIPLGALNPNYKKAQQLADLEVTYKEKADAYQSKYANYTDYLKALSDSFVVVASLDELKSIDLTTTTAEKMSTDMGNLLKDCTSATKALESTAKPADLSKSSTSLNQALVRICTESIDSLEDGPIVLLVGKTGVLSPEDQAKMRLYLDSFGLTSTNVASTEANPEADTEALIAYQQSALEDATALLQQAEAIIKG